MLVRPLDPLEFVNGNAVLLVKELRVEQLVLKLDEALEVQFLLMPLF
jgi:hypothetical protein